jgi:predicted ferric reductase
MTLISLNILLATRVRFVENIFSGLDKVYVAHKYSAYFIFILIILHNTLIQGSRMRYSGFFSLAKEVANPLMWAFFALIIISTLPHIQFIKKVFNIPYHIWKYTHYLMGILFLVGIYHSLGVKTLTFANTTLSIYMYIVYALGAFCLIYKSFLYKFLKKKYLYKISKTKRFEKIDCVELHLTSVKRTNKLAWKAGQFAFFKFEQDGLKEIHPFTISNSQNEKGELRLSIKSLGGWTNRLVGNIKEDTKVIIDGPYGKFNSRKDKNNLEIWIAGGIGITPFLAMLEDYKLNNNLNKKIIFVWSVKGEAEAIYKEEIYNSLPENIKFILHDTSKSGFFRLVNLKSELTPYLINRKMEDIAVYICGPAPMREAIIKDARLLGVTDFHFEEFSFR